MREEPWYRRNYQMFYEDRAGGKRNCKLCLEPIKRGQKCYTMYVRGQSYTYGIHIHKQHIKGITPKNCRSRIKCVTGDKCHSPICKLNKPSNKTVEVFG